MITKDQITIGVELEMIIYGFPDSFPVSGEFKLVAQVLAPLAGKLGTYVIDTGSISDMDYDLSGVNRVAAFQVQEDTSISVRYPVERGVEVATPILRNGQWETTIPDMCQALKANFRLGFNSSTGLHVNIAIGRDYTLQELKRISKAVILFEAQMDTYHPGCRSLGASGNSKSLYWIQSSRHNRTFESLNNLACLEVIEKAANLKILLSAINRTGDRGHSDRCYKYNLTSVMHYNTVEFRQAMGTDDEGQIKDWIDRVIQFVTSAISTPDDVFDTWAREGINDPSVYPRFGVPVPNTLEEV